MVNFNSCWSYVICFFLIIVFCTVHTSSQTTTIYCYECTNCTDPFNAANASTSTLACNACFKLAVKIAYAPYTYVIRKCVPACLETAQQFGGGSITSSCCATNLCNTSSMITFSPLARFFWFFIFIILSFRKHL